MERQNPYEKGSAYPSVGVAFCTGSDICLSSSCMLNSGGLRAANDLIFLSFSLFFLSFSFSKIIKWFLSCVG